MLFVAEIWHEACLGEGLHGSKVGEVNHDCLFDLTVADVGHDAVAARGGGLHDAGVAIDGD